MWFLDKAVTMVTQTHEIEASMKINFLFLASIKSIDHIWINIQTSNKTNA